MFGNSTLSFRLQFYLVVVLICQSALITSRGFSSNNTANDSVVSYHWDLISLRIKFLINREPVVRSHGVVSSLDFVFPSHVGQTQTNREAVGSKVGVRIVSNLCKKQSDHCIERIDQFIPGNSLQSFYLHWQSVVSDCKHTIRTHRRSRNNSNHARH